MNGFTIKVSSKKGRNQRNEPGIKPCIQIVMNNKSERNKNHCLGNAEIDLPHEVSENR